jgi:hypothetical protein
MSTCLNVWITAHDRLHLIEIRSVDFKAEEGKFKARTSVWWLPEGAPLECLESYMGEGSTLDEAIRALSEQLQTHFLEKPGARS